jgi:YHS domain-containing protein
MKTLVLLMAFILIFASGFTGCGKKTTVNTKTKFVDQPMSTVGFGTLSGTCSVCKTKSEHLRKVSNGDYRATVCSPSCGTNFQANPTYYGDHYTVTRTAPPPPTKGFGATKGTCSVCGKKADDLLAVKVDTYNATVCSMDCGGKFRAAPAQYSKK